MKAIGYQQAGPLSREAALQDLDLATPVATGRDVLVKVQAIAVNPVDYKIRQNVSPEAGENKVLGWDAVGEVVSTGEKVTLFAPGDSVYYAGDLTRQGSNAEYQLVDERLIAQKPKSLSLSEAAAMPLTTITAWELLFEHLKIAKSKTMQNALHETDTTQDVILVVGASGGVGSILVQLIKQLTRATVIATASRPETQSWVKALGADYVVDHSQPLVPQIKSLALPEVTHVASLTHTASYLGDYVELLKPMGKIALIDDPDGIDIKALKPKSLSLHWEFMFTRSMFRTHDMIEQHKLLTEVAELIDRGVIKTTVGKHLGSINAANLRQAHALLESGRSIGKIVLEGFE